MCSLLRYSKVAFGLGFLVDELFQDVILQQQLDALAHKELVLVRSVCDMVYYLCCIVSVHDTVAGNL